MRGLGAAFLLVLSACAPNEEPTRPDILPTDFALLPCGLQESDVPCAMAVIGGKRLLFGAPAGIGSTLDQSDLRMLDGVFLFSLRASDIEGLDEVRNESWRAGRSKPLPVAGPDGTAQTLSALNLAFETGDALRIVDEGVPPGGFDAAVLVQMGDESGADNPMFDTGDVLVRSEVRADQAVRYLVSYRGADPVIIEPCLAGECSFAGGQTWPLLDVHFIVKQTP